MERHDDAAPDPQQHLQTERELRQKTHQLKERVKELNCLYATLRLTEDPAIDTGTVLKGIMELIPRSWQYPEITAARITVDGKTLVSPRFRETEWMQRADIRLRQRTVGGIEVYYLEEKPAEVIGPFLIEEKWLIEALAETVGRFLERQEVKRESGWELEVNRTLSSISRILIGKEFDAADVAGIILEKTRTLTEAEHGYVAEIDESDGAMVSHTLTQMMANCPIPENRKDIRFARGEDGKYPSLWGHSLNTKKSLLLNSLDGHPSSAGIPEGHVVITNLLSVPAMLGDTVIGQITLGNRPGGFSERHRVFVEHVAQLYALALQRKRAETRLQGLVEERTGQVLQRQRALEAVYRVATAVHPSFKEMGDMTAEVIAGLLNAACVKIRRKVNNQFVAVSVWHDAGITVDRELRDACGPCREALEQGGFQDMGDLREKYPESPCLKDTAFKSYIGVPVRDLNTLDVGQIVVMDLRERTFTEDELHLLQIFARYIAHEIEREASEGKLRQAREMEIFGQLASGVAHEVRNPLNAILAVSEALFMELEDNPDYQEYVDHIKNQVGRLAHLMNDLLNLGRPLQLGNMRVKTAQELTEEAVRQWRQTTAYKKYTVTESMDPGAAGRTLRVDEQKFQQIFINLLDNACQHGKPDNEITVQVSPSGDNHLCFQVRDRGKGVPEENLGKIFNPFFTSRKGGTGLGTSIVKHFVTLHDGSIRIFNNDDGPGCTVEIILPVYEG